MRGSLRVELVLDAVLLGHVDHVARSRRASVPERDAEFSPESSHMLVANERGSLRRHARTDELLIGPGLGDVTELLCLLVGDAVGPGASPWTIVLPGGRSKRRLAIASLSVHLRDPQTMTLSGSGPRAGSLLTPSDFEGADESADERCNASPSLDSPGVRDIRGHEHHGRDQQPALPLRHRISHPSGGSYPYSHTGTVTSPC